MSRTLDPRSPRGSSLRTPEVAGRPRVLHQLYSLLARRRLQPLWRALRFLSLRGMGFKNIDPRVNGELRFWRDWAARARSKPGPVVIFDVGANEGDFSAELSQLVPEATVHCFEPNPPTLQRLSQRFAGDPRFHINPFGLSNREEEIELFDLAGGEGSGQASCLGGVLATGAEPLVATTVPMSTLDAYAEKHGIQSIDLLKIDVEGFEPQVLEGAEKLLAADRIDVIQLEWNLYNATTGFTLYRLLQRLPRHRVFRILADGLHPLATLEAGYASEEEIFLYANLVAVHRSSRIG